MRITWSGVYLHAAPWSVGSQGSTNVSHGCINMSPEDAATYYDMSIPGDPVTVQGQLARRHVRQRLDHVVQVLAQVAARQRAAQGRPRRPARQHVHHVSAAPFAASQGLSLADPYVLGLLAAGLAVFVAVGALSHQDDRAFSASAIYLGFGLGAALVLELAGIELARPGRRREGVRDHDGSWR